MGKRTYILRVCNKYGYSLDCLHHLFHSPIMSLFTHATSAWGSASYNNYLAKIDKFQDRAFRFDFLKEVTPVTKTRNLLIGDCGKVLPALPVAISGPLATHAIQIAAEQRPSLHPPGHPNRTFLNVASFIIYNCSLLNSKEKNVLCYNI